jgi:hypothetical protein
MKGARSVRRHRGRMQTCDQPALGWTVVLRRQPARIVEGRAEGGYTDVFELICCYCGDHPDLDHRDVSPELQRIRGPYPIAVGVAAYEEHLELHHDGGRCTSEADAGSVMSATLKTNPGGTGQTDCGIRMEAYGIWPGGRDD